MKIINSLALSLAGVLVAAVPAFCQQPSAPAPTDRTMRGYVAGSVGAVTGPPAEGMFALEWAENAGRHAQGYVNFSYLNNVMPSTTRDALGALPALLPARPAGTPNWQFTGRDRGLTLTAGLKGLSPALGALRFYGGGGVGVIEIQRTITEVRLGNVTQAVFNDFGLGETTLLTTEGATKGLGEIIAGVAVTAGHTYIDFGYKYRRVFGLTDYNFSQLAGGIGYKW